MSIYHEKARELAQMILASDMAKNMADASAAYEADSEAVARFEAYKVRVTEFQAQLREGSKTEEEYQKESTELNDIAAALKEYPSIAGMISAEDEFNEFVTQIMDVMRVGIMGSIGQGCGSGGDGCSGCGDEGCRG